MFKCRVCGGSLYAEPLLELTNMPASAQNLPDSYNLDSDVGIDLQIFQCSKCGLVQIPHSPVSYYRDVIRAVGISDEMKSFRENQFSQFIKKYDRSKIVEIGAGHGEFLSIMSNICPHSYGIEHSGSGVTDARKIGLEVTKAYIDNENFLIPNSPFDSFYIMSFLEHVPDINSFLGGLWNNLTDDAIGLIEVPNFNMIIDKQLFSEFILDHLFYFTEATLKTTLEINGFEVLECNSIWHDYILSVVVRKRKRLNLKNFLTQKDKITKEIVEFVNKYPDVSIWGAGHQSFAIMALVGLQEKIKYVVDSAKFKQGKYTPSTHIPIVSPKFFRQSPTSAIIVIAGSYSDEVVKIIKKYDLGNLKIAILKDSGLEIV